MKKKLYGILTITLLSFKIQAIYAQEIKGMVVSADDNSPLPEATVCVLSNDSLVHRGGGNRN